MDRNDYTTKISYYIPNVIKYHFIFPLKVLTKYNGKDNLDVTLDDNLTYFIIEPILNQNIEYDFELIWKDEGKKLDICVKVNSEKFDSQIVLENLKLKKMIEGLELFKEEFGKLNKIY